MPSRYDDELWALVPAEAPSPVHLVRFVRSLDPAGRALDLGCGDGRLTGELEAETLTAADVSDVALDRARQRLRHARIVALVPDQALPFEDGAFDTVLCTETIEHVRDVQLLLSEMRRVLRPGGLLALTTPAHGRSTALRALLRGFGRTFPPLSPHLRFFSRRSLAELLDELGFEVVRLRWEHGTLLLTARR